MAKVQVISQPLCVKKTRPFRHSRFNQKLIIEQQDLGGYFQDNKLSGLPDIASFVMLSS